MNVMCLLSGGKNCTSCDGHVIFKAICDKGQNQVIELLRLLDVAPVVAMLKVCLQHHQLSQAKTGYCSPHLESVYVATAQDSLHLCSSANCCIMRMQQNTTLQGHGCCWCYVRDGAGLCAVWPMQFVCGQQGRQA